MLHHMEADVESAFEEVQSLFERLGPTVPAIVRVVQQDEQSWYIKLDTGTVIAIEWSDIPPRLVFITEIGCPPAAREMDVFRMALTFNRQSSETGGAKIALSDDHDQMLLMFELFAEQVSLAVVGDFVNWFRRQAGMWQEFVTATRANPLVNPGSLINRA